MRRGFIVASLMGLGIPVLALFLLLYLLLTKQLTIGILIPGVTLIAILVPLTIYYLMNLPIAINIDTRNKVIVIKTVRGIRRYTYITISCVDTDEYLKWRICSIGLPGLAIGVFTAVDGETVHAYTDTKLSLLVKTIDGKRYLFSLPKNLEILICKNNNNRVNE